MGRYTTVQTYTDQDAKVAAITYSSASGSNDAAAQEVAAGDTGPQPVKSAGGDAATKPREDSYNANRVDNVSGSSAGSGSGDFHMYRAARRRELDRVTKMETDYAKKKEQDEFETKRKRNLEEFESRAAKRAEKRRRRKDRAKERSMDEPLSDGEQQDHHGDKIAEKGAGASATVASTSDDVLPETPGGVPEIANDGSFLARMLALQKAQEKQTDPKSK